MNTQLSRPVIKRIPEKAFDIDDVINFLEDIFDLFNLIIQVFSNFGDFLNGN